jgi:hypothetical protein
LGLELAGVEKPAEGDKDIDYNEKTKDAEAKFNYRTTVENLNNPPSLREMQEKRIKDAEDEKKASAKRAQDLEDERLARIEAESQAAGQEAQRQKELREKAEDDLRKNQNQLILDEIRRLHEANVSPEQKITEYFAFQEMMETKFGSKKEPATAGAASNSSMDAKLTFEIEKMKLDFEKWKVEQERANKQLEYDREDRKEDRKETKALKMEELQIKKDQQKMISDLPKVFADTLAAGLVARAGGGAASSVPISANPGAVKVSHFEAVEGEAGELDCPDCNTKVGVGPTTVNTICSKCGRKFEIQRVAAPASAAEHKSGQPAEERRE